MRLNLRNAKHVKTGICLANTAKNRALVEQEIWSKRLEAIRGSGSPPDVSLRLAKIGVDGLIERLTRLSYPSTRKDRKEIALNGDEYSDSWVQRSLEHLPDRNLVAIVYAGIKEIEQRDRVKAWVQFWEILGIHPDDVPSSSVLRVGVELAWYSIVSGSAAREMAKRAEERSNSEAVDHYSYLADAFSRTVRWAAQIMCSRAEGGKDLPAFEFLGIGQLAASTYEEFRQTFLESLATVIAELEEDNRGEKQESTDCTAN